MSKQISVTDSINVIPSGYSDLTNLTTTTSYPVSNGYTGHTSTTYARLSLSTSTTGYVNYTFNVTGIPSGATITSVTGTVKAYVSSTSRVTNTVCQLYTGTTAKGSNVTFASTSSTNTVSLSVGSSWAVSELSDLKLRIGGTGSSSSGGGGNSSRYIYFYGATITISYSYQGTVYEITSVSNTDLVDSINPEGVIDVSSGESYTLRVDTNNVDNIAVEDNGTDVTSQLVQHANASSGTSSTVLGVYTLVSGTFNGSGGTYFSGIVGNGVNGTQTTSNYYSSSSGTITVFTYKLDLGTIPSNATITRLYCQVNGHAENASQTNEYMCVQLRSGDTELSTEYNFKSAGTSNTTQTIEATTLPTIAQLENLVLYCRLGYFGGAINGATCYLEYTVPVTNPYYYTYTLTNVSTDHTINVTVPFVIPPDEDPELTYYPITISSINATTTPSKGTTRVESGTSQTITIVPSDPLLTLVTDNGTDITSQLVSHQGTSPSYTVTTAPNATYGFNLNSSTGYYISTNAGVSSSASVARVTFNLPVRCLITIKYINYAESTYDFGVFSKVDTTLSTVGWTAGSSAGDTTTDAGLEQIRLNTSAYNTSSEQTLTYEISSGEHYIDVKYGKDQATDSNNDSLQFKIDSIQELEANNYYTYTLSNISQDHSLIFIFGDVSYYFVNSSTNDECRLYPNGSMVQLPGDSYKLVIVPDNINDTVSLTDNNTNVTSSLTREETTTEKSGETVTVVNYIYRLTNIQATHNLVVSVTSSGKLVYYNDNGWNELDGIYKKQDGRWNSVTYTRIWIHNGTAWVEDAERTIITKGIVVSD